MKLSDESIKSLQELLKEVLGLDYTDLQAQEAGMDIMRFVIAKARRKQDLLENKENEDGQKLGSPRAIAQ